MKKKLIAGILSLIMAVTPFVSLPAISYADSGTCGVKQGATDILKVWRQTTKTLPFGMIKWLYRLQ